MSKKATAGAKAPKAPIKVPVKSVTPEPVALKIEVQEVKTTGKVLPFVSGILHEGKELTGAQWQGDKLVVMNVEGVTYTLSGSELDEFLKKVG